MCLYCMVWCVLFGVQRMKENKGMARLIAFITDTQPTEEEAAAGGKGDKGGKGKGKKAAAGGSAKKKPAKGADGTLMHTMSLCNIQYVRY